jgi:hypothetical protein
LVEGPRIIGKNGLAAPIIEKTKKSQYVKIVARFVRLRYKRAGCIRSLLQRMSESFHDLEQA